MEQWMKMEHPDLSDSDAVLVTVNAFENLYRDKGWVAYGDVADEVVSQDVSSTPSDDPEPEPKPKPKPKPKS